MGKKKKTNTTSVDNTEIAEMIEVDTSVEDTKIEDTNVEDTNVEEIVSNEGEVNDETNLGTTAIKDKSDSDEDKQVDGKDAYKNEEIVVEDVRVRNLRLIAAAKERLERENEKLSRDHKEALAKLAKLEEKDDEFEDDDLYSDSKKFKKLEKQIEAQEKRIQAQEYTLLENALKQTGERLRDEHSDFATVVSNTNVAVLKELDRDLYDKLAAENDLYKKGIGTYKAILKHQIIKQELKENKATVANNLSKPKPSFTATTRTSSFSNLYSSAGQQQLRKELEESRRKV